MKTEDFWFGAFLGFTACLLLAVATASIVKVKWELDAIDHNCAAYDQQTGEWHWIERGDAE